MNRFEEAEKDLRKAIELGDTLAAAEIIDAVQEEARGYGFEELSGQLRVYNLRGERANQYMVLSTMARRAVDIDYAARCRVWTGLHFSHTGSKSG